MLKNSNNITLKARGVDDLYISFYQIWQELVSNKTLDTYQYRIFTTISILNELLDVINKSIDGVFTGEANLDECKAEALSIIRNDKILDLYFHYEKNRLLSSLASNTKEIAGKNRLKAQISYLLTRIEKDYYSFVFNELENAITNNNIEDIECYANTIASQAVTKGWSTKALFELLRLFTDKSKSIDDKWRKFKLEVLSNSKTKHVVLICIPFSPHSGDRQGLIIDGLEKSDLYVYSCDELLEEYPNINGLKTWLNSDKRYFKINTFAYDIYSAAHSALCFIADKLNLVSFYNLLGSWDLSSVTLVPFNTLSLYCKSFSASDIYRTYDYLDSSGKIYEDTKRIFLDENFKEVKDKLQGTFSYTNISRCSLFQEEKYMNLWIALESLSRTKMYTDIISNVKTTVPAAETLRYMYRIIRNYAEDLARCSVDVYYKSTQIDLKQDSKQNLVKEMIALFSDEDSYNELLNNTRINSLLSYRTQCIYKLITDEKYTISKINNHYDKVKWQIQRLYRIRNEIAHTAVRENTLLIIYIEHLYDYLSKYIAEIVTCLIEKGYSSIEESLISIKDNYDCYLEITKENYSKESFNDLFNTGIINFV